MAENKLNNDYLSQNYDEFLERQKDISDTSDTDITNVDSSITDNYNTYESANAVPVTTSGASTGTSPAQSGVLSPETLKENFIVPAGKDLRSEDYNPGKAGWIVRGDGFVEFMDGFFRGVIAAGGLNIQSAGNVRGGQQAYNTGIGFWLGYDNGKYKISIGDPAGSHITWDGTNLSVVGGVDVSELHIPDSVTSDAMNVDSSGNAWWGSNEAAGYAAAKAYIKANGDALFKNVNISGTLKTVVFQKTTISAVGGNLMVLPSDSLSASL